MSWTKRIVIGLASLLAIGAAAAGASYAVSRYLAFQQEIAALNSKLLRQSQVIAQLDELLKEQPAPAEGSPTSLSFQITAPFVQQLAESVLPIRIDLERTSKKTKKLTGQVTIEQLSNVHISGGGALLFSTRMMGDKLTFHKDLKGWKGWLGKNAAIERLPVRGRGEMRMEIGEDGLSLIMHFMLLDLDLGKFKLAGLTDNGSNVDLPVWLEETLTEKVNESLAKRPSVVKLKLKPRPVHIGEETFIQKIWLTELIYSKEQIQVLGKLNFERQTEEQAKEEAAKKAESEIKEDEKAR